MSTFRTTSLRRLSSVRSARTAEAGFVPGYDLVLQAAHNFPKSIAVRSAYDENEHTYEDLEQDAIGLASYLQSLGVGVGSRVALAFDRSYDLMVALLGTWLSGAAYVALDAAYPESRIEVVLEDSESSVVVTTPASKHMVPASYKGRIVNLDPNGSVEVVDADDELPYRRPKVTADTLASVWYTSGTTGKPKGVLIDHGAFAQALRNIPAYDGFGPGCCFGQVSSPSYPGHVNDIWMPLTKGAAIAVIPKEILLDPPAFSNTLAKLHINAAILTPKILEMYADLSPHVLSVLKLIQFAGERMRLDAALKLAKALPEGTLLQHLYGCTEHCTIVSCLEIRASAEAAETLKAQTADFGRLPVGMPRPDVKIYILDPDTLTEKPEGEVGEVYLCSRQLAVGYNKRPDATEEKFKTLPATGERIYRTGDLGRMAPHGLGLDILGRAGDDGMVKVNGFRIELGEIESAAMNAKDLETSAAVATLWKGRQLVLYVCPDFVDTDKLKERLKETLPHYMVPAFIEALPMLPLTVASKVDRAALPDPVAAMQAAVTRSISIKTVKTDGQPPNELELLIMDLFSEVLQIPVAGLTPLSSFAGLGGHSLLGMALLGKLREEANCPALQLMDLVHDDCPRHLATVVEQYRKESGGALPKEVQRMAAGVPGETPVWVLHGGVGRPHVGLNIGRHMKRRPLYTIELSEDAAAASSMHPGHPTDGLVAYYINIIKSVQPKGPYIIAGNRLAFALAHTLESQGDELQRLIIIDDNHLWFDRALVDAGVTNREHRGAVGMIKLAVLDRSFPNDPARVQKELDRYEAQLNEYVAAGGSPSDMMAAEVGRWMGKEEGEKWALGLRFLMPILLNKERPCARLGKDIIKAPISLFKAADSWSRTRIQELYDPAGLPDYSWSSFTSWGPVGVFIVPGAHYSIGNNEEGAPRMAVLFDQL